MKQNNMFLLKPLLSLFVLVIILFFAVVFIGSILTPFIIAVMLSYILNPIVEFFEERYKVRRWLSTLLLVTMLFSVFIIFAIRVMPNLLIQLKTIFIQLPNFIEIINQNILQNVNHALGANFFFDSHQVMNTLNEKLSKINRYLYAYGSVIFIKIILYSLLIPITVFYVITNWYTLLNMIDRSIPRQFVYGMRYLFFDIDQTLSVYLRGQLLVMVIMSGYYMVSLEVFGLNTAIIIGLVTGLLVFIPYFGVITGFLLSVFALSSPLHGNVNNAHQIAELCIIFGVGHLLESGLITPWIISGRIGIHPLITVMLFMIFAALFGVIGILLALPLSVVIVVIAKHLYMYYLNSHYYKDE